MEQPKPSKTVEEILREQGVRALSFREMLGPLGGDEAKENVDEFLASLREIDSPSHIGLEAPPEPLAPAR